jgi:hypothetical protein
MAALPTDLTLAGLQASFAGGSLTAAQQTPVQALMLKPTQETRMKTMDTASNLSPGVRRWLTRVAVAAVGIGVGLASFPGLAGAEGEEPKAGEPGATPGGTTADSLQVLEERAAGVIAAMGAAQTHVMGLLKTARDQRDVVRVLCLDDKTNQVESAIASAQERQGALTEAVHDGSRERAAHEFTLLEVLKERVNALAGEAGQCVGAETGFTGESSTTLSVDLHLLPQEQAALAPFPPAALVPGYTLPAPPESAVD